MFTALLRAIIRKCESFLFGAVANAVVFSFTYPLEAEDSILLAFEEELRGNCLPFD